MGLEERTCSYFRLLVHLMPSTGHNMGFPGGAGGNTPCSEGNIRDAGLISVRKILWRRAWQPTPVFLPGESHEQSSLAGYSPWGHKDLNMTVVT